MAMSSTNHMNASKLQSAHSVAEWNDEHKLAKITQGKGKLIITLGFTALNSVWLYPEEVVFLLHQRGLRLRRGDTEDVSLSYFLIHLSQYWGLKPHHVQTYIKLKLFGYVIQRRSEWTRRRLIRERIEAINDFHQRRRAGNLRDNESEPKKLATMTQSEETVAPQFMVWLPEKCVQFRRANPASLPHFRVITLSFKCAVPTHEEFAILQKQHPSIPIRIAVVDTTDVLFFDILDMDSISRVT